MKRTHMSIAAAALLLFASTAPVAAQPPRSPESIVQVRLGAFMPSGDSNFWDATEELFTLDISDFDDVALGLTFVRPVSNQVEIGFNADFFHETVRSQVRGFVDEDGFPIQHDTELGLVPLTVDVRFIPGGRYRMRPGGRQIIKPVFYIGAGAGLTFWEYEEYGDFLDFTFDPPEIFQDRFVDDGVAFELHALAGVEIPLSPMTNLLFETRYAAVDDDLSGDFADLAERDLDLSGSSIYAGLSFRF